MLLTGKESKNPNQLTENHQLDSLKKKLALAQEEKGVDHPSLDALKAQITKAEREVL